MMQTTRAELQQAHRALCSGFVSEELFRRALGGNRGDISRIAAYLACPVPERPALSWYFDAVFYVATNADIAKSGVDPLLHFLTTGVGERRAPHPLIDLRYLASQDPGALGDPPQLEALVEVLDYDLASPSPYFDSEHYRHQLDSEAPENGLLRHFLAHGVRAGRTPNRFFDPAWYVEHYPDVPRDPYLALRHFITQGDAEGRAAGPAFDGARYRARYPDIADAGAPPLRHYLMFGQKEGRQTEGERQVASPPASAEVARLTVDAETVAERHAALRRLLGERRQQQKEAVMPRPLPLQHCDDPRRALAKLKLPKARAPRLSILVPMFNELALTVECLLSIRASKTRTEYEVVVADDASTEEGCAALARVPNLVLVRRDDTVGFLRNCNDAFARCRGEYVLLLNNDAQVMEGALDALVAALDADPKLSAAGPKIVYPDGRLQEAGCFLKPNGESGMVGLFADPEEGGYNYDRDVTYCSGAALLVRRAAVGSVLFDEDFRPAYCEDADLCLRLIAAGGRVRYVSGAVVVHHLSVSTNKGSVAKKLRLIARNQQRLSERWNALLAQLDSVRVLAFYLPQFHPTPENDLWWGAGFTEWANVARARPSYLGHLQPHLPADLGFYDLREPRALAGQARLARRYGIEGFCVYYYNFGSRRMLAEPLEVVLAHPEIPFSWCLCWANENWTRHWDGGERAILLEQNYDDETISAVLADAVRHARDPRYLRVGDRPLFLVYRPLQLPDAASFAARARATFAAAGHAGVHLVYVESMEAVDQKLRPADIGFDAAVEFPPHGRAVAAGGEVEVVKENWSGYRYDYVETLLSFLLRPSVPYARYAAVFPNWDNTPRQPLFGTSFDNVCPEAFRLYVEEKIEEVRRFHMGDERLLFVNAWNEWAEGAHLEPDVAYGHRWLEALAAAVAEKSWR